MLQSEYTYHRQFYLDRVATADNGLPGAEDLPLKKAQAFEWWLQDFKRNSVHGYSKADMTKAATELRKLPTASSDKRHLAGLGFDQASRNNSYTVSKVEAQFKLHNVKNWILTDGKQYLLHQVTDEALINQLINESAEF